MATEPESRIELDSRSLRGIAHPLRVRLLGMLREHGPSTASRLAARIGTTSGATSYHLRQLALYGFVVEDEGPADRQPRERWWRAAHRSTSLEPSALATPEDEVAAEVYLRSIVLGYSRRMQEALDEWPVTPEWRESGTVSDWSIVLDPATTDELVAELEALIERHSVRHADADPVESRRPVTVQLQVFPRPGWTPEDSG